MSGGGPAIAAADAVVDGIIVGMLGAPPSNVLPDGTCIVGSGGALPSVVSPTFPRIVGLGSSATRGACHERQLGVGAWRKSRFTARTSAHRNSRPIARSPIEIGSTYQ